jgi:hypothetical protein
VRRSRQQVADHRARPFQIGAPRGQGTRCQPSLLAEYSQKQVLCTHDRIVACRRLVAGQFDNSLYRRGGIDLGSKADRASWQLGFHLPTEFAGRDAQAVE